MGIIEFNIEYLTRKSESEKSGLKHRELMAAWNN